MANFILQIADAFLVFSVLRLRWAIIIPAVAGGAWTGSSAIKSTAAAAAGCILIFSCNDSSLPPIRPGLSYFIEKCN